MTEVQKDVQKGFRMSLELSVEVDRLAATRNQSFTEFAIEAIQEKVSGKASEEAKAAAIEISDFVKALQDERRSQNQLTDILDKLTRMYTSTIEDRSQILANLNHANTAVEKTTQVLESLTKSTNKAADECIKPLQNLNRAMTGINTIIEGPVNSVRDRLAYFGEEFKTIDNKIRDQKQYSVQEISRLSSDFKSIIDNYRNEVVEQTKSFVIKATERWLIVAGVLVFSVFIGGGCLSAWLYFNNDSGIVKLKKDVKLYQQNNFFYQKEACLNRKADIHKDMCKLKGLMEGKWENPYPSNR